MCSVGDGCVHVYYHSIDYVVVFMSRIKTSASVNLVFIPLIFLGEEAKSLLTMSSSILHFGTKKNAGLISFIK